MQLAPDPPRDSTSDGDGNEVNSNEIQNYIMLAEEDIGEGEHELDFSSHESDLTDDDDGEENERDEFVAATFDRSNENVRVRARYQLLIPFANINPDNDESVQEFHAPPNEEDSIEDEESPPDEVQPETVSEKREIIMNEEKAETIKNVMKNFSLPSSSIPPWAKEINDDAWKTKLFSKLEATDSNSKHQASHNTTAASSDFQKGEEENGNSKPNEGATTSS